MSKEIKQQYDICICGGGIAGLLLAYTLGKEGLRVLIVERNAVINPNGADVLKPSGIEVLEQAGLLGDLLEAEARVRHEVKIFYNGQLLETMDYRSEHTRSHFMLVPYKVVLNVLLNKLQQLSNVDILLSTGLTGLQKDAEGAVNAIELNNKTRVECRVLVGADGVKSTVREMMNIDASVHTYSQAMYFSQFPMVASADECNRLYVDSNYGLAYFYPINNKEFRCIFGFNQEEGTKLLKEEPNLQKLKARLKEFVTESDDVLDAVTSLSGFATFPLCKMHAAEYYRQNVVLLGNAAHAIHPITGQGMNLAIEDAGVLYPLLKAFFDNSISLADAFKGFSESRRFINGALLEYGHRLATSFHSKEQFKDALNLRVQTSNRVKAVLEAI